MTGPYGSRIVKWIGPKGLTGDPCKVAVVVRQFCVTQGFRLTG
jgi:hypothetical protein